MSLEGISFIVRVHNEENILEKSIRSLFSLTFPHEIVIILHLCTDRSLDITKQLVAENPKIRYITYDYELSRAGYENLATDSTSKHSLITYVNFCMGQGKYIWKFKWDSDFIASPKLIDFLNSKEWKKENAMYSILAKNSSTNNWEGYLMGCLLTYKKHIFWEVPFYNINRVRHSLSDTQYIEHASELSDMKPYWNDKPWYQKEDSDEARLVQDRINKLTDNFGKEPIGMARASNKICNPIYLKIKGTNPNYINLYS